MTQVDQMVTLDTTDVDRYVGQPVGGGQLKEPVSLTDVRRWVQGMDHPNPLHYDEDYAAGSTFGRIVAPQSFTICCDVGHGAVPAIVGQIPDTHMIFGGDEWWMAGPRIYAGDHLRMRRRFIDYKISDTKFAGPTMFSRGETIYENQRGDLVARQWSTFATEWRAYIFTVWGSTVQEGYDHIPEAGWLPEMDRHVEEAKLDPSMGDGLYQGPSRGHTDEAHARVIGMPRSYGYGASMGAWVLDYVAMWAGDRGFVRHSNMQYRFPAFEGDVTLLDGEVTDTRLDATLGAKIVSIEVTMTNQDGSVMAKGPVEVELPE